MPIDVSDIENWSDAALEDAYSTISAERDRRSAVRLLPTQVRDSIAMYQRAARVHAAVEDNWTCPAGLLDVYLAGSHVTHGGSTWVALRDGATGEPGVATDDWGLA